MDGNQKVVQYRRDKIIFTNPAMLCSSHVIALLPPLWTASKCACHIARIWRACNKTTESNNKSLHVTAVSMKWVTCYYTYSAHKVTKIIAFSSLSYMSSPRDCLGQPGIPSHPQQLLYHFHAKPPVPESEQISARLQMCGLAHYAPQKPTYNATAAPGHRSSIRAEWGVVPKRIDSAGRTCTPW